MRNIKNLILAGGILATAVAVSSCDSGRKATTADGTEYKYIKEGSKAPNNGEYVLYHFTAENENDSTFISSYEQHAPAYLQYNDTAQAQSGIDEIFMNLKKGDSILVETTAEKMFGGFGVPPFLTAEETIRLRIGVVDVLDEAAFQDFFTAMAEEQQERQARESVEQTEADIQIIENYIAENNLQANRTESGLFYVIEEEGSGKEVNAGDMAKVHYTGYVLDGRVFDTSREDIAREQGIFNEARGGYEPIEVQVGAGRVIQGWDEGLQLLRQGSKAKLLIPSPLAYGNRQASEVITPNSVLVFDVEVTDVK
ncbi:FKBP-type peptidyl-prolyl cis-trans isomerase [Litoribacter populi]|uniref:FKBP-type peptidyl-prolyl cis-trans isomerase n=1 Tax=Litoribacter populi TaxID=2598460 RepID=UPI001180182C|nr:FKBP-type peptidyl-prolyl cis-trans isomerase [Litoribacter populi]